MQIILRGRWVGWVAGYWGTHWSLLCLLREKKPGDNDQSRDQRLLGTREERSEVTWFGL